MSNQVNVIIVDYGLGNVGSVKNALQFLGVRVAVSGLKEDIRNATHIILPGVGSFGDGIRLIKERGLTEALSQEVLEKRKPFLGICLGMQLLADFGEEGGVTQGLGWIPGRVRKFDINENKLRLPHVGWDDVTADETSIFKGVTLPVFYFVHNYVFVPDDENSVIAVCEYGERFAAAIRKDNIYGVQFHPEKSQKSGLLLLSNFLKLDH